MCMSYSQWRVNAHLCGLMSEINVKTVMKPSLFKMGQLPAIFPAGYGLHQGWAPGKTQEDFLAYTCRHPIRILCLFTDVDVSSGRGFREAIWK